MSSKPDVGAYAAITFERDCPQADSDEPAEDWATFRDIVRNVLVNKNSNAMLVFILFSTEDGETTTGKGHEVFFNGKADKHERGVGILVHKDISNNVTGCRPVFSRLINIRLGAVPFNSNSSVRPNVRL